MAIKIAFIQSHRAQTTIHILTRSEIKRARDHGQRGKIAEHELTHPIASRRYTVKLNERQNYSGSEGLLHAGVALRRSLTGAERKERYHRSNKGHYLSTSHTFSIAHAFARVHAWPGTRVRSLRAINGARGDFSIPFASNVEAMPCRVGGNRSSVAMTCRNLSTRLPIRYLGSRDAMRNSRLSGSTASAAVPPLPTFESSTPHPPPSLYLFLYLFSTISRSEKFSLVRHKSRSGAGRHQSNTIDSPVICFPENTVSPSGAGATWTFIQRRTVLSLTSVDPRGRPRIRMCILEPTYLHSTMLLFVFFPVFSPSSLHRRRRRRRRRRRCRRRSFRLFFSLRSTCCLRTFVLVDGSNCVRACLLPSGWQDAPRNELDEVVLRS